MDPSKEDIRFVEPTSVDKLIPTPLSLELWLISGVVLLVVMLAIWMLLRRFSTTGKPSPDEIQKVALEKAMRALASCPIEQRTPAATECSLILRRYLASVVEDPALFETHEEWVSRHGAIENFGDELKTQINSLFTQLANWKYAPTDHGDEPVVIIEQSRRLLDAINREVTA